MTVHARNNNEGAMRDKFIGLGGAVFTVGLVAIPALAAFYYIIKPIICGVSAGCGSASW